MTEKRTARRKRPMPEPTLEQQLDMIEDDIEGIRDTLRRLEPKIGDIHDSNIQIKERLRNLPTHTSIVYMLVTSILAALAIAFNVRG